MHVRSLLSRLVAVALVAGACRFATAQVLYRENFDDGTAASSWTVSQVGSGNLADFNFDYATAGIPAAPNGTGTKALRFDVNTLTSGSAISAIMAFPNGQNFSGNHTLAFDLWFNVVGTANTTEFGIFGLNHTTTTIQAPTSATPGRGPSNNGIDYAMTGDNGAARDVRVYINGTERTGTAGGYASNYTTTTTVTNTSTGVVTTTTNNLMQEGQFAPYNFGYTPVAFGTAGAVMPGNQWLRIGVSAYSGTTVFQVNGQTWARTTTSTGTGNIMLGYMDLFTSVATVPIFSLYDNVTVSVADPLPSQLVWSPGGTAAGGSGNWSNLGTQWISTGTTPTTWDWSLPAKFQGTGGTVTIGTQVTSGAGLEFVTDGYVVTGGTMILGSYNPAVNASFNTNAVARVTVAAGASARIESIIRGSRGITKLGEGTLVLANVNPVSGTSVVQSGTLVIGNQSALSQSPVNVVPGGTLKIDPALGMIGPRLIVNGGTVAAAGATLSVDRDIGVRQLLVNSGEIAGSPALEVTLGGTMIMSGSVVNTVNVSRLLVDETITATGTGGRIDVGIGRINVAAGGITAQALVVDLLAGKNGVDGGWDGATGITSSVSAASGGSRTVGWLDNGDSSMTVAFAAPGDTNLDWQVDILDSANFLSSGKLDSGLPATWVEGDFTYDGFVDVLDAAAFLSTGLLDAGAYNPPPGQAGIAAVPEPSTIAAAGILGLSVTLLHRRRRGGPPRRAADRP